VSFVLRRLSSCFLSFFYIDINCLFQSPDSRVRSNLRVRIIRLRCATPQDCVKKTLTLAGRFEHEKRACEPLRQVARTLLLLLLIHSKMEIRAACNKFLKGEWESLWNKCMAKGHARQDKLAAHPLLASSRTSAQKDNMAQNRLGLATFPKQIKLYARSLNRHLGTILCTNCRKRHQSVQSFSTDNFG